jgi:hypothetical protein
MTSFLIRLINILLRILVISLFDKQRLLDSRNDEVLFFCLKVDDIGLEPSPNEGKPSGASKKALAKK